jgi:hypothetical protein
MHFTHANILIHIEIIDHPLEPQYFLTQHNEVFLRCSTVPQKYHPFSVIQCVHGNVKFIVLQL